MEEGEKTKGRTALINNLTASTVLLVFVPLLGSALAISCDVGFFQGINIHYFTLFSLSEHIVFALEVFPYALVLAAYISASVFLMPRLPRRRPLLTKAVDIVFQILVVVAIGLIFKFFLGSTVISILITITLLCIVFFAIAENFAARALIGFTTAVILAYGLGYLLSYNYLDPASAHARVVKKNGERIDAALIRSGDRGVLFLDFENRQVTLLPWDEITEINTSPSTMTSGPPPISPQRLKPTNHR